MERHVVIIGTAIAGSGSFSVGLDNFIHTGFSDAFVEFLPGKTIELIEGNGYHVSSSVYAMSTACLATMIAGAWCQYFCHTGPWVPRSHHPSDDIYY
ncbi:hypothetical protein BGX27_010963, partial [Mortierella sp. AM989]